MPEERKRVVKHEITDKFYRHQMSAVASNTEINQPQFSQKNLIEHLLHLNQASLLQHSLTFLSQQF